MTTKRSEDRPTIWEMVVFFIIRTTDSGLAAWTLVALFILGLSWVVTRNLESKDELALITSFIGLKGVAWLGWLVAFLEIPVFRWSLNKARKLKSNQMDRIQAENEAAREALKKKQIELELEH